MNIFTRAKYWFQDKYENIRSYFYECKLKRKYPDYEESEYDIGAIKFIWGVKSRDDLCGCPANLYTMNDIEVDYNREAQNYVLSIETAYMFKDKQSEVEYLSTLLDLFTKYMIDNNLSTNEPFFFFFSQPCTDYMADSIEELYTNFKIFVEGYKALYGKEN